MLKRCQESPILYFDGEELTVKTAQNCVIVSQMHASSMPTPNEATVARSAVAVTDEC